MEPVICALIYKTLAPILVTESFRFILMSLNIFSGLSVQKLSFLLRTKMLYSLISFND